MDPRLFNDIVLVATKKKQYGTIVTGAPDEGLRNHDGKLKPMKLF